MTPSIGPCSCSKRCAAHRSWLGAEDGVDRYWSRGVRALANTVRGTSCMASLAARRATRLTCRREFRQIDGCPPA